MSDQDLIEQLRVQLSGCSAAALQNSEESKTNRAKQGNYGWSVAYQDVCDAVDREIELRKKLDIAVEALEMAKKNCVCTRLTNGFDYNDMHDNCGRAAPGKRWNTPSEIIRAALAKIRGVKNGQD